MQVCIPQFQNGLSLKPPTAHEQTKHDAGPVLLAAGLLGSENDLLGDDAAVGLGDEGLFELAGHAFLDQVAEAESDFGDFYGGNDGVEMAVAVLREHCQWVVFVSFFRYLRKKETRKGSRRVPVTYADLDAQNPIRGDCDCRRDSGPEDGRASFGCCEKPFFRLDLPSLGSNCKGSTAQVEKRMLNRGKMEGEGNRGGENKRMWLRSLAREN